MAGTAQPVTPAKKGWRGKLLALLAVGLLLFIAIAALTGLIGYGWASLRSSLFPRDEGLLEYIPGDAAGVLVVDLHQLDLASLGDEKSTARVAMERMRNDVKKATGINIAFDVDKLAISQVVAVARGRFSRDKLEARLMEHRYVVAEHRGVRYLARKGDDAIAVIDDLLLYGSEEGLRSAIDAKENSTSLEENPEFTRRLSQMGWNHALLATVQMSDERPSLRAILTGGTGPRAFTAGVSTMEGGGLFVNVIIETVSANAAEELAKLLEQRRADVEGFRGFFGEAAPTVAELAKTAKLRAEPGASAVHIELRLDPAGLDRLLKAAPTAGPAGVGELSKAFRLHQLLAPGP